MASTSPLKDTSRSRRCTTTKRPFWWMPCGHWDLRLNSVRVLAPVLDLIAFSDWSHADRLADNRAGQGRLLWSELLAGESAATPYRIGHLDERGPWCDWIGANNRSSHDRIECGCFSRDGQRLCA